MPSGAQRGAVIPEGQGIVPQTRPGVASARVVLLVFSGTISILKNVFLTFIFVYCRWCKWDFLSQRLVVVSVYDSCRCCIVILHPALFPKFFYVCVSFIADPSASHMLSHLPQLPGGEASCRSLSRLHGVGSLPRS